jgi:hypothetical protein
MNAFFYFHDITILKAQLGSPMVHEVWIMQVVITWSTKRFINFASILLKAIGDFVMWLLMKKILRDITCIATKWIERVMTNTSLLACFSRNFQAYTKVIANICSESKSFKINHWFSIRVANIPFVQNIPKMIWDV